MGKKNHRDVPGSGWMRVCVILFMIWMGFTAYRQEQKASEGDKEAITFRRYEAIQEFSNLDEWIKVANPSYGRFIETKEIRVGEQDFAACGQKVRLKIKAVPQEEQVLPDALSPPEPVEFTVGIDAPLEAWDRGVRGMRKGGIRNIIAGPRLVFDDVDDPDAPPVYFELNLLDVQPNVAPDQPAFGYTKVKRVVVSTGTPVSCGDDVALLVKLYDKEGKTLYTTEKDGPLRYRVGTGAYGHGMDRGLIGMHVHEERRLIIPPPYQPQQSKLPFPKDEIAIVELMRVPYKDDDVEPSDESSSEEQEYEPDSEPIERDQTIPDDGGNSESSGT